MDTITSFVKDSVNELWLVTWPSQERLLHLTIVCVIFVLASAAFLGLIDFGFNNAYKWLLTLNA